MWGLAVVYVGTLLHLFVKLCHSKLNIVDCPILQVVVWSSGEHACLWNQIKLWYQLWYNYIYIYIFDVFLYIYKSFVKLRKQFESYKFLFNFFYIAELRFGVACCSWISRKSTHTIVSGKFKHLLLKLYRYIEKKTISHRQELFIFFYTKTWLPPQGCQTSPSQSVATGQKTWKTQKEDFF